MCLAASVCAVRLAACVWPEGEQATGLNVASGVPMNFVLGGGVQLIQLRTERTGIWGL